MPVPKEVFLSHASQNHRFATRLAETLERHKVRVWYSKTKILGAQQWHDEIGAALERCDWFMVILSPSSLESMWVRREVMYALEQERLESRIVPLLYRACEFKRLSWTLSQLQRVDFQKGFAGGCEQLLRIWGKEYQPEPPRKSGKRRRKRR